VKVMAMGTNSSMAFTTMIRGLYLWGVNHGWCHGLWKGVANAHKLKQSLRCTQDLYGRTDA
jgi:hypothetical protein